MSFGRGGRRGGRFGGRGNGGRFDHSGPPDYVIELGVFEHPCEGEAVCKLSCSKAEKLSDGPFCRSVDFRFPTSMHPSLKKTKFRLEKSMKSLD